MLVPHDMEYGSAPLSHGVALRDWIEMHGTVGGWIAVRHSSSF